MLSSISLALLMSMGPVAPPSCVHICPLSSMTLQLAAPHTHHLVNRFAA
jgi:hypothetical protein